MRIPNITASTVEICMFQTWDLLNGVCYTTESQSHFSLFPSLLIYFTRPYFLLQSRKESLNLHEGKFSNKKNAHLPTSS